MSSGNDEKTATINFSAKNALRIMAMIPELLSEGGFDVAGELGVHHPPSFGAEGEGGIFSPDAVLDAGINAVLAETGALLGVSRAYVMQDENDGNYLRNTHEWVDGKIASAMFSFPLHSYEKDLPSLKPLMDGRDFFAAHTKNTPPDLRKVLTMQGVLSVLLVPLPDGRGKRVGLVGFDSCSAERSWREEEIVILKYIARMFCLFFERREYAAARYTIDAIREMLADGLPSAAPAASDAVPMITAASAQRPAARGRPRDEAVSLQEAERNLIVETLARYNGNKSRAARELGLKWAALDRRCKKLGITT